MNLPIALALASIFYAPHHGPAQITHRSYGVDGWRIGVNHDTFTGAVSCSLQARGVYFRTDTLIFRLRRGVETTHAVFRVGSGPAKPVAEAFRDDEARGIFPQRGWIDDPAGGDVALPASYLKGATRLWIRASPTAQPQVYNIGHFKEALSGARAAGCQDGAFAAVSSKSL